MDPILSMSATELSEKIREGDLTSTEVVDAHIVRIKQVNPTINAVVAERFEAAREQAAQCDRTLNSAKKKNGLPPLFGVPCTIKENHACIGMPNTSGLVARKGVVADFDATTVARLKAAGAIVLGVTNTSELCMWFESSNRVYGRSNNPYDVGRIVGGSSGGEGAIIGAGGSPFGLGSDIGGSIRLPAFFNGVFGHKATGGLIPGTGQHPIAVNQAQRYLTSGPLARRATDLWPLIRILAGPDGQDTGCRPIPLGDPESVDLADLSVVMVEGNGVNRVRSDMLGALRKAAGALDGRGAKVTCVKVEKLKHSMEIWSAMLAEAGGPSFSELLGNGQPISAGTEILKWAIRTSDHTLPALMLALFEKIPQWMPERAKKMLKLGRSLKQELVDLIGPNGILLYPSFPSTAPRHRMPLLAPFQFVYTAILNVMELPVTQVPMGLSGNGLPLGVQVAALEGNDHMTVAVAMALEEQFGGWIPPRSMM